MFKVNSQLTKRSLSNSGLSELKLLAVGDFTSTAGLLLSSLELLRATLVGDLTERAGSSVLAGGSGSGVYYHKWLSGHTVKHDWYPAVSGV